MEYYSGLKRNEFLTFCNMDELRRHYASHERTNIVRFHLSAAPRVVKFIGTESGRVVAEGWGKGVLCNGYRISVREEEKLLSNNVNVLDARVVRLK